MATIEAYLEALKALQIQTATESLAPSIDQRTEFRFGYVCGVQEGLRKAEELLNKQLEEEDQDDGINSRRHSPNRRR